MNRGFTLAEIIITIGIIGIVAALTIPAIASYYYEKSTVTKLKKVNSMLLQTFNSLRQEEGDDFYVMPRNMSSVNWNKTFIEKITPYFEVLKYCPYGTRGCLGSGSYRKLNGTENKAYLNGTCESILLKDNTSICIKYENFDNLMILVDTNGPAKPNQYGKDLFHFFVVNNKLEPYKMKNGQINYLHSTQCRRNLESDQCAGWVIGKENMDYLHCDDLDWDLKPRCR